MGVLTKEMFHSSSLSALLAVGVQSHAQFESFVVCPDYSVENLECSFSSFGGERREAKQSIGTVKFFWIGAE
jgi:hypothetical protein